MTRGGLGSQVAEALLDAYLTHTNLRMLTRIKLDESLEAIADEAKERVVVFNLIAWAERSGRVDELG
ncbi:MAG: effector-associated domain EAD1-containing protein, partial [Rubrivivax sp.]